MLDWVADQGVEGSRPVVTLLGRSLFVFVSARQRVRVGQGHILTGQERLH